MTDAVYAWLLGSAVLLAIATQRWLRHSLKKMGLDYVHWYETEIRLMHRVIVWGGVTLAASLAYGALT